MVITPGLLSPSDAALLAAAAALAEQTRADLDNWREEFEDNFPAKLTAWDAAYQAASWTEQTWDASGLRVDKLNGRSGTATDSPAKPVGNGLMPPDSFPVEVWLTRRLVTPDRGPIYEFPWVCACAGSGSGSGSGSGILVGCCPGAIPPSLTATFNVSAGSYPEMDGQSITLTHSAGTWSGEGTFGGVTYSWTLTCDGTSWSENFTTSDPTNCGAGTPTGASILSCSPVHLLGGNWGIPGTCSAGANATFQVTYTE